MMARLFNILSHLVLDRLHFLIQIVGAGDQVLWIGVLAGKPVGDQMTAVIEIFASDKIVFYGMPAGGFDHANRSPLLRRDCFRSDTGVCHAASAQTVQRTVAFKRCFRPLCNKGLIVIDNIVRQVLIGRDRRRIKPGWIPAFLLFRSEWKNNRTRQNDTCCQQNRRRCKRQKDTQYGLFPGKEQPQQQKNSQCRGKQGNDHSPFLLYM